MSVNDDSEQKNDLVQIAEQWGLTVANPQLVAISYELILDYLAQKIAEMLQKDKRKLFQSFYRLDVNEEKVRYIIQSIPAPMQYKKIAELVLKRELEKAKTRREFGG